MSYRAYAKHRGVTLRAVQKAVGEVQADGSRAGRIAGAMVDAPGSVHAKIDSDLADQLWTLNTDEAKRSILFSPGPEKSLGAESSLTEPAGIAELAPDALPGDPDSANYRKFRTIGESIKVEHAQLDLDERKGKLVDLDDACRLCFTALRALRDSLRNTGARIAAQLAASDDTLICEQLVNAEIDSVLKSITPEKILTEIVDEDDEPDNEGHSSALAQTA